MSLYSGRPRTKIQKPKGCTEQNLHYLKIFEGYLYYLVLFTRSAPHALYLSEKLELENLNSLAGPLILQTLLHEQTSIPQTRRYLK